MAFRNDTHGRNPQFCLPMTCDCCGKVFSVADHGLMKYAQKPDRPICPDCLFKQNMNRLA
jgi:hypothetical protein